MRNRKSYPVESQRTHRSTCCCGIPQKLLGKDAIIISSLGATTSGTNPTHLRFLWHTIIYKLGSWMMEE